jgi:capsular exopolysaccharide synthesis family protein
LRAEKATLEAEYREKSTYLGDDYPDMVRLRARINAIEQAINNASGTASTGLGAEYRAALAEENALREQVKQLSTNMLQEQELSSEYKVLQREVETKSSLYQALLERYNQIGVVEGVGNPVGAVVDPARPPGAPYTPNIPRSLTLGLVFGLGLGLAAIFIYEFMTDRIKTPDDVRDKLRQTLLGTIPLLKRGESLSDAIEDAISPISEAYSSMLTSLQFTTHEGMPQVLAITSVGPAEGKSTTSLVLAQRLANIGRKVLLIDGDMRRPSFVFEEEHPTGLSQLLTGHGDLKSNIIRTATKNLFLIQSGPIPPNPSILLNSRNLGDIIAQLRAAFDNIIIDCPPKLGLADAALLGGLADGTLMIVESGKTRRQVVLEAIAQLRASGNRVLGVTLTKVPRQAGSYGYSYQYYNDTKMLGQSARSHELSPEPFAGGDAQA